MNKTKGFAIFLLMSLLVTCKGQGDFQFQMINDTATTIKNRINPPGGFERVISRNESLGEFLQNLKLLPQGSPVKLHTGELKYSQIYHVAVIDLDVGTRDLQQCADAVIRLHAEYLYKHEKYDEIAYNFISDGKPRYFLNYSDNLTNYKIFRKYLDYIYSYANTRSLFHQLEKVGNYKDMQIGDVFIQTGNPFGHAVMVVDMSVNKNTGEKLFLLAQSYMPAQSIHILINPKHSELSPWYSLNADGQIITPEWTFCKDDLKRFK